MDARSLNSGVKKTIKAREQEIDAFINRLDGFLQKNLRKILRGIEDGDFSASQAAQALGGLQDSLRAAGLGDKLAEIAQIYGSELREIKSRFKQTTGKDPVLNEVDIDVTQALVTFDADVVANRIYGYVDDIRSVVMRGVITGNVPRFDDLHEQLGGALVNNLNTELNTALSGFSRTVNLSKADDLGIELFLYAGPDDGVTRPFCQERVGQIFTREEIESWDNDQGLPADVYLGGYNCRHRLDPVSAELAEELGYDGES